MSNKIGLIVGSLRKDSYNKKIAKYIGKKINSKNQYEFIEIGDLPLYNEDIDHDNPPKSYSEFRKKLDEFQAFIFFTPEYNRSIPAVLKNALDIGSRPYGSNKWDGKPAGIVSISPGAMGAFGANHHLRQCLTFLNMPTLQQPEMYLGHINKMIDENGEINSDYINKLCDKFVVTFETWIEKF